MQGMEMLAQRLNRAARSARSYTVWSAWKGFNCRSIRDRMFGSIINNESYFGCDWDCYCKLFKWLSEIGSYHLHTLTRTASKQTRSRRRRTAQETTIGHVCLTCKAPWSWTRPLSLVRPSRARGSHHPRKTPRPSLFEYPLVTTTRWPEKRRSRAACAPTWQSQTRSRSTFATMQKWWRFRSLALAGLCRESLTLADTRAILSPARPHCSSRAQFDSSHLM